MLEKGSSTRRLRISRRVALVIVATALLPVTARAGALAPCTEPFVYSGADVNVLIPRFESTTEKTYYSEAANRLAALIEFDVLFSNLAYGSIGVTALVDPYYEPCPPLEEIIAMITTEEGRGPTIRPGKGLVVLSGRIFEKGEQLYLQTTVRFLRQGVDETLELVTSGGERLTALLPTQSVQLPPRRLTPEDLARVDAEFESRAVVHRRPDASTPGQAVPLEHHPERPFAYFVAEVEGEWMRIEPFFGGPDGWIQAGSGLTNEYLHQKLPELELVSALIGYLRVRIADSAEASPPGDTQVPQRPVPSWTAGRASASLARFADSVSGPASERSVALAKTLDGVLTLLAREDGDIDALQHAALLFEDAARLVPFNAKAHQLAAIGRAYLCEKNEQRGECFGEVWPSFERALILSPQNDWLLSNSESYLTTLAEDPGFREDPHPAWKDQLQSIRGLRSALQSGDPTEESTERQE